MKYLIILNDPPYGTERCFNGFRLARALQQSEAKPEVALFLMADAVLCAKAGQITPNGYYNLERMIKGIAREAKIVLCGTCLDARGITDDELVAGAERGTMPQLAEMTNEADKVLIF